MAASSYRKSSKPLEEMTAQEQYDEQVRDLYHRAMSGDTSAKKLWFEMSPVMTTDQTFNIAVDILDYKIKDKSVKAIMGAAERHVIHDALVGLMTRMELDEAPHELRDMLKSFDNKFQHWAARAYEPKNA